MKRNCSSWKKTQPPRLVLGPIQPKSNPITAHRRIVSPNLRPVGVIVGNRTHSSARQTSRPFLNYDRLSNAFITTTPFKQTNSPDLTNRAYYTIANRLAQYPIIQSLFEEQTGTWQYLVADPSTKKAVIIDPVLDYDHLNQAVATTTADELLKIILQSDFQIERILETHAHADHLTAAAYLQQRLSEMQGFTPPVCIGKRINQVQELFAARYGIPLAECKGAFDHLFEDGETFKIGQLTAGVIHLPGHTPDHVGYKIGDNVFCGDSIFHADIGTARCDFPGGSAKSLFQSAKKLLELGDDVKIWSGHDYPNCPARCDAVPWMTVLDHKEKNKHLLGNIQEADFITLRNKRDADLAAPRLLHPSLQINIRGGKLPEPAPGGQRLLHLPISGPSWTKDGSKPTFAAADD